jgi:glyceraldehyde-3-phosphate dehydrogenase (NADP+)
MNNLKNIFKEESEIPSQYIPTSNIIQKEYLINGVLKTWDGPMNEVKSPVFVKDNNGLTQKIMGKTPLLTEKEALEALDAAVAAYNLGHGQWPTSSVAKRIEHVEKFLSKMKEKREEVVNLLMWEIGKNLKDSEKEFDRTCDYILDTINGLKELDRKSSGFEIEQGIIGQIRRVPLGVALCMGPYNYPLNETFTTLIPALIMGNTVVFKPAKFGVLLVKPLLEAFKESFPPGVINIIYGRGRETVGAVMATGKIDVLAFIGTNKGANDLKRLHPKPHRLRSVLGLDAKNPAIVLSDANLDVAVDECVAGSLSFNGQRCTALKILFVHKSIVEEFNKRFIAKVNALKGGLPWEEGVSLTPLPEPGKVEYLNGLVEDAKKHGALVINEGGGQSNETFYFPAVLYPVNSQMKVYDEEQFGPVVPIVPFENEEEAINYVVNSNFGQQLSIFSQSSEAIGRLVDLFANQVGRININAQCQRGPDSFPFNGRKDSAEGTLSVSDALRVFSIRIIVAAKYNDSNKQIINNIVSNGESAFLTRDYIF